MSVPDPSLPPSPEQPTTVIVRDAIVLQGKLIVDGIRDALLIPVSLIAAVISIFQKGPEKGRLFYDVVHLGKRSERWINLFGAVEHRPEGVDMPEGPPLDAYLAEVERRIVKEYRDREVTRSAREAIDGVVERIEAARRRFGSRPPGGSDPGL